MTVSGVYARLCLCGLVATGGTGSIRLSTASCYSVIVLSFFLPSFLVAMYWEFPNKLLKTWFGGNSSKDDQGNAKTKEN